MRLAGAGDNRSRCRVLGALVVIWLLLAACSHPAISSGTEPETGASGITASSSAASPTAPTVNLAGRIVFERWDASQARTSVFIANADGSGERELFGRGAEIPHWSPDGKTVSVFCCDDGMVAHLVDVPSDAFHEFPPPDPSIEAHCGPWSADGSQLLCESYGTEDASRNGVYAIGSTDGQSLTQLTSNPHGDDSPGSESANGEMLVFNRSDKTGAKFALFVADLGGRRAVKQITPWGSVNIGFYGRFSPDGSEILFASAENGGIWAVAPDGGDLHQVYRDSQDRWAITPTWSPDGDLIMFGLASSGDISSHPGTGLYVVDRQGNNLTEILPPTSYQANPDWAR